MPVTVLMLFSPRMGLVLSLLSTPHPPHSTPPLSLTTHADCCLTGKRRSTQKSIQRCREAAENFNWLTSHKQGIRLENPHTLTVPCGFFYCYCLALHSIRCFGFFLFLYSNLPLFFFSLTAHPGPPYTIIPPLCFSTVHTNQSLAYRSHTTGRHTTTQGFAMLHRASSGQTCAA